MKIGIAAFRLLAGAFLALGFALGGTMVSAAPANAQEQVPWYMPQPWMHPPQTGPRIRKLQGYYGHNLRYRSYGSFGRGCYGGDCGYARGTVTTGSGMVLSSPVVVIYNPNDYELVERTAYYGTPTTGTLYSPPEAVATQRSAPIVPKVVSVREAMAKKQKPNFTTQNGVRIIGPAPLTTN